MILLRLSDELALNYVFQLNVNQKWTCTKQLVQRRIAQLRKTTIEPTWQVFIEWVVMWV